MTKQQYKNLLSSFRWAVRRMPYDMALAWIAHWNCSDAELCRRTYDPIVKG